MAKKITITQEELKQYKALEKKLHNIEGETKAAKAELQAKLESGAIVEEGKYRAKVETSSRRTVKWKEEFVKHNTEELAKSIIEDVEPTSTSKLVVYNGDD